MSKAEQHFKEFEGALQWFSGKGKQTAWQALCRLATAAERGFWLPEDKSRSIRASLNKSNLAARFVKTAQFNGVWDWQEGPEYYNRPFYRAMFSMHFGEFDSIQGFDVDAAFEKDPTAIAVRKHVQAYKDSFTSISVTLKRLDDTRPQPVFTEIGASPTVTATLKSLGLDVLPKARVCPIKYEVVQILYQGKIVYVQEATLLWPEGTVHGASRYHAEDSQCEACGHGIKVVDNWVPLILDNAAGVPHALWVGRDCCRTIFGIKVTGELRVGAQNASIPQASGTAVAI